MESTTRQDCGVPGKRDHCLLYIALLVCAVLLLSGCAGRPLMPTPKLLVDTPSDPFGDVPAALQTETVDVLYVTDRKPEQDEDGKLHYGYLRSNSLGWGIAKVSLDRDGSWSGLVEASRSSNRQRQPQLEVISIEELGRSQGGPYPSKIGSGFVELDPVVQAENLRALNLFQQELARQIERTPRKEVMFYIHGFNEDFNDAALTLAELWHFGRREGVAIAYTWPAGHPGLLRGYVYDRESGEFTIRHLKETIRAVSNLPEVERVHLVAHSRGTDVALTALRELFIEAWASGISPRERYRIDNLVLAAPDLDAEIVDQRVLGEHIHGGVSQLVIYTSPDDRALSAAERLLSSPRGRVGRFSFSDLTEEELEIIRRSDWENHISIINVSGLSAKLSHNYFRTNPAVSSDLLLLFDGYAPGSPERPLVSTGPWFWEVPEGYPNNVVDERPENR